MAQIGHFWGLAVPNSWNSGAFWARRPRTQRIRTFFFARIGHFCGPATPDSWNPGIFWALRPQIQQVRTFSGLCCANPNESRHFFFGFDRALLWPDHPKFLESGHFLGSKAPNSCNFYTPGLSVGPFPCLVVPMLLEFCRFPGFVGSVPMEF